MKKLLSVLSLCVLSAQAFGAEGEQLHVSSTAIASARVPLTAEQKKMPVLGAIATNTPAFEEYGFDLMLSEARRIRKARSDIPPLSVNNVFFSLKATPRGVTGAIFTRDRRFNWNFGDNCLESFVDTNYWPQSFRYNDDASAKLTKVKSRITAKEAEEIARDFLHKIGYTEKQLGLIEPPEVNQYKFQESNDVIYPLPCFNVRWKTPDADEDWWPIRIDVSGIINNVADYCNSARSTPSEPLPTNYMEMLEVSAPTNNQQKLRFKTVAKGPKETRTVNRHKLGAPRSPYTQYR